MKKSFSDSSLQSDNDVAAAQAGATQDLAAAAIQAAEWNQATVIDNARQSATAVAQAGFTAAQYTIAATRTVQGIYELRREGGDKLAAAGYLGEAALRLFGMKRDLLRGIGTRVPSTLAPSASGALSHFKIGNFSVLGSKQLVGKTFQVKILMLGKTAREEAKLASLFSTLEKEAAAAGGNEIRIVGEGVRKAFTSAKLAEKYGYELRIIGENTVEWVKKLL